MVGRLTLMRVRSNDRMAKTATANPQRQALDQASPRGRRRGH
jgi:hypothetical protein